MMSDHSVTPIPPSAFHIPHSRMACVLIPRFAVAIERQVAPELVGVVVIGGHPYERKHVYDCSEEAAACGVEVGLSLRAAHDLCPEATFLPVDEEKYARSFREMCDILDSFSPLVEAEGPGRCFLDVRGLRLLHGNDAQLARKLATAVRRGLGLTPLVGIAGARFVAQVAAGLGAGGWGLGVGEWGTNPQPLTPNPHFVVVPPGQEKEFLAPLPVSLLPCSAWMLEHLARLGIQRIGELAALPANTMMRQFGPEGVIAHRLANGSDERVVRPAPQPEKLMVSRDLDDVPPDMVWFVLPRLIGVGGLHGGAIGPIGRISRIGPIGMDDAGETGLSPLLELVEELHSRGQMCQRVVLSLERDDGTVEEAETILQEPTSREDEMGRALERLWRSLSEGRSASSVPVRWLSAVRITVGDLCRERGKVIRLFRESGQGPNVPPGSARLRRARDPRGQATRGAHSTPALLGPRASSPATAAAGEDAHGPRIPASNPQLLAPSPRAGLAPASGGRSQEEVQIARVVDHVQARLGKGCLKRAVLLDGASRLPERRFTLVER